MKARILLIASIFLNAGLLGAYFVAKRPPEVVAPDAPETPTKTVVKKIVNPAATIIQNTSGDPFSWTSVESEDYKKYIANLRAIGCPEETIRDIIIADVNKLYAAKIAALRPPPSEFKFWKTDDKESRALARDRRDKERALEQEKRTLIKELLGVDLDTEVARSSGRVNGEDWRNGFLPAEKQEQLKAIRDKYQEQERALFADGGIRSPENRAKLLALRTQQEAEIAQTLTPAEYEEYQLRNSGTARNMRDNLASFQPTETEFREIYKAQKAFDDQYGGFRGPGGGDDAGRAQAQQQLDDQLKALLGDRYKDYTLAQDPRYRDAYDFTQDKTSAEQVYNMRTAAEDERRRIMNDQSITADQRPVLLADLANQTKTALTSVLGPTASQDYMNNANWVNRLQRAPGGGGGGQNFGGQNLGGGGGRNRNFR